jgi:D-aminopeptidase
MKRPDLLIRVAVMAVTITLGAGASANDSHPRARAAGIAPGIYSPGEYNAITDVAGVRVGQFSLAAEPQVRTGVTAIIPHSDNIFQHKVPAGFAQGNGFGKMMGTTQIIELGELETPVLLTNTLSVPEVAAGVIDWTLRQPGNEEVRSVNAVVGETNDGRINNIRQRAVRPEHAISAIAQASAGPVAEGSVGAGVGTVSFGWKGGIGTSSRVLPASAGGYTVGVLVQTNYGGELHIMGVPVTADVLAAVAGGTATQTSPDGSVMIIIATDAPLSDRNLERLASRAFLGLARTGSAMSNGSGDYALAFSTAESVRRTPERREQLSTVADLPNNLMTPLFQAVVEATEEAVYNALFKATAVDGVNGDQFPPLPVAAVIQLLRERGVLSLQNSGDR